MATVESLNAQVTGDLITLSEQELVDCDMLNSHCLPGYTHKAYEYIVRNGGIDTDTNYPYRARQRACKANRVSTIYTFTYFLRIFGFDIDEFILAFEGSSRHH